MARKKKPEPPENAERWLLTYSDLITLLMAFFIVMYASSSADSAKMAKVAEAIKAGFNSGTGKTVIGNQDAVDIKANASYIQEAQKQQADASAGSAKAEENKLQQVKQKIDNYTAQNGLSGKVSTIIQEKGLVINIVDSVMFDTAKADIKPDAQASLVGIAKILKTVNNLIVVEGHTDSRPLTNAPEFENSNDVLSAVRAIHVQNILVGGGVAQNQISEQGYGATRPVATNDTEDGMAKNRRVDIVVVNSKFSAAEQSGIGNSSINTTPSVTNGSGQ